MTSAEDSKTADEVLSENILRIADELVKQVDRAKKLALIAIAVIVAGIPIAWHAAPLLTGAPSNFRLVGYFTIAVAIVFLAVGVRQWMVLSKWTERYKAYQELQRKIDAKLDFESHPEGASTASGN